MIFAIEKPGDKTQRPIQNPSKARPSLTDLNQSIRGDFFGVRLRVRTRKRVNEGQWSDAEVDEVDSTEGATLRGFERHERCAGDCRDEEDHDTQPSRNAVKDGKRRCKCCEYRHYARGHVQQRGRFGGSSRNPR